MSDRFSLNGEIVIVTGGAGFLGKHICLSLAEQGAKVACIDREESMQNLLKGNANLHKYNCDVSNPVEVRGIVQKISDELGTPGVLINGAATKTSSLDNFFTAWSDYPSETWDEILSVNLSGTFYMAREVAKVMIAAKKPGSIVQLSSIYGSLGPDNRIYQGALWNGKEINTPPAYAASKGGVNGLTSYLSTTLAPHKIRVNTLTLGGIESLQNEAFIRAYSERVPLGRMGTQEEVCDAIIFLASKASSYVTGQNLFVDGGLSAW
jgi:NAD(P)-dependent dehydrogenase (short-subunit alcohol dehydrogenase family)